MTNGVFMTIFVYSVLAHDLPYIVMFLSILVLIAAGIRVADYAWSVAYRIMANWMMLQDQAERLRLERQAMVHRLSLSSGNERGGEASHNN